MYSTVAMTPRPCTNLIIENQPLSCFDDFGKEEKLFVALA